MEELYSPRVISELLRRYGLAPLKKLGQNFLKDENIVNKIAQAAAPDGCNILEIGPGLGTLTRALSLRAKRVVAVEIDHGMVRVLQETVGDRENVRVLEADFLKIQLDELCREYFDGESFVVAGNLPYYITSKCLMKVLESGQPILRFTAMVQKEVADRLSAKCGDADYGGLSASVAYFGGAQRLFSVSRGCFLPEPDVDSAVIQMIPRSQFDVPQELYSRVVRGLFAMRRKTVQNNLKNSFGMHADRSAALLLQMGISPKARAEELTPEQFAGLAEKLLQN